MKKNKGFTLVELMIASTVSLFVVGGIIYSTILFQRLWQNGNIQITMQSRGRIAMDTLTQQIRSAHQALVLNSGATLQLRLNATTLWCQYDFLNNKITYTPDTSVPGTTKVLVDSVYQNLATPVFTLTGKNVAIVFALKNTKLQTTYKSSYMESSATVRNE
ncbi:MAG: prepilin-type N-terminal cleavage/methylation domain-containing protein [Candidatus Omnitrophota bacterium]